VKSQSQIVRQKKVDKEVKQRIVLNIFFTHTITVPIKRFHKYSKYILDSKARRKRQLTLP
jgi:hypothetical protein